MTTFLLVHGGWHGAWCWERLTPHLRRYGHAVVTPTLTALGERAAEAVRTVNVSRHAEDVVEAARRAADRVVLVSHSYSGFPVEKAVSRIADVVQHVVHVDAFVPRGGDTIMDYIPPHV